MFRRVIEKDSLCFTAEDEAVGRSSAKSEIQFRLLDAAREGDLSTCDYSCQCR